METQTQGWRGGQRRSVKDIGWQQGALRAARTEEHREYGWSNNKMVSPHHHFHSSLPPPRTTEWEWLREKKKNASACCERHCIIYTEEHKQSWTNCLKRKMWSLCIHRSIRLHARAHSRTARSLPAAWKTSLLLVPVNVSASLILHSHLKTLSSFQTGRVRWWEDHQ